MLMYLLAIVCLNISFIALSLLLTVFCFWKYSWVMLVFSFLSFVFAIFFFFFFFFWFLFLFIFCLMYAQLLVIEMTKQRYKLLFKICSPENLLGFAFFFLHISLITTFPCLTNFGWWTVNDFQHKYAAIGQWN